MQLGNSRNRQGLIFQNIIRHSVEAIHDERLHVAKGMDCPAKMAPMVHQGILRTPGVEYQVRNQIV